MSIGQNISVSRNAVMAVVQAVTTGGVLFLFYRYLLKAIGPEQVGVWAVVLATASTSRISEMGFTGSAVKFTAKYVARGEPIKPRRLSRQHILRLGFWWYVFLRVVTLSFYGFWESWFRGVRNRSCQQSSPLLCYRFGSALFPGYFLPDWMVANVSICAR